MKFSRRFSFDIVFIAIIHIAGIIGIRLFPELFLKTSFISIVIPLSLFLYRVKPNRKDSILMSLVYIIAFFFILSFASGISYTFLKILDIHQYNLINIFFVTLTHQNHLKI